MVWCFPRWRSARLTDRCACRSLPPVTKKLLSGKLANGQQPAFHLLKVPGGGDHPTAVACSREQLVVATARDFGHVSLYALNGRSDAPGAAQQLEAGLSSPAQCLFLSGAGSHPFLGISSKGIDTSLRLVVLSSGAALPPLSFRHQRGINEVSNRWVGGGM